MSGVISLKRLTKIVNRGASPVYDDFGTAKFINQACIYWTGVKELAIKPADESKHRPGSRGYLEKGDILVNSTGTGTLGRAAIFNKDNDGSYFADSHVTIVRPDPKTLDSSYAKYVIQTDSFQDKIYTFCVSGSTNQIELSRERFRELELGGIEVHEQKKLADYLDTKTQTLDKILTAKNHTRTHLSELRQAIITELVYPDGGRVMSGSDQLYRHLLSQESGTWGEDPNGINEVKCLRVADFDYGHLSHIEPSTVRSIAPTHIRTKMLQTGDILIEKSGGGEKTPVGRAILIGKIDEPATYANFIDRLRFKNTVLPEYALYLLYAMYAGGVNTKYIKQNTGIQNLDIKHYLMEPVSIPDIDKQREIVSKIKSKLQKIDKADATLQKSISQLEEYRSSLISNVVGGKVEV